MTTLYSLASLVITVVDSPGIGSAKSKRSASSFRQKYWERNSSWRQMICAPALAASTTLAAAFSRFSEGLVEQDICTSPTRNGLWDTGGINKFSHGAFRAILSHNLP